MQKKTGTFSASARAVACFVGGLFVLPGVAPAQGQHTTQKTVENFNLTIPSCSGEQVRVSGPIDVDVQTTVNPNGSTIVMQFTPHLTAIGLTSGMSYIAVGPAKITTHTGAKGGTT